MHRNHLLAPAAALALLAAVAAPAAAGTGATMHLSQPLEGATITCGDLVLTPVEGSLDGVMHESMDGRGVYHFTGTEVAHDAVLEDAARARYRLVGASSFSGTSTDADGNEVLSFRTEVSFVVLRPDGGRLGTVRMLERVDAHGDVSSVSGGCVGAGGVD